MLAQQPVEGHAALRFAQAVSASRSLERLERVFVAGFQQPFDTPIGELRSRWVAH